MSQPPRFDIVPDHDAIAQLDRDMRFFPVSNEQPERLTPEQIAHFNREGYLSGITIFDEREIAAHRRFFDDLLQRVMASGGDSYSISTAHLRYATVYDLLAEPRIVDCVRDLLGRNVIGWGSHYFCKMPHDGKAVAWHQDASYWPLTPSKTVTVWLAIDDADTENACMQFIPRSHLQGLIPYRMSEADEANVLNQTVEDLERFPPPVPVPLKAGQISIHSDLLLHGSTANNSDRRRCGLTLRYCASEVHAHLGWNQKGVVVAGTALPELWPGAARPQGDATTLEA